MKKVISILLGLVFILPNVVAKSNNKIDIPRSFAEDKKGYMSEAYWSHWNAEEQAQIDADIEKYRKADGKLVLKNIGRNRKVKIEQISHEFYFGSNIFNFNQLGKTEYNDRYKRAFGELFNSATIPFYWRTLEQKRGMPRFETAEKDTEAWWNSCEKPNSQSHWRRPSTDQIVDFCEEKGIRAHGHVLVWGSVGAQMPSWLKKELMTKEERETYARFLPRPKTAKNREAWKALTVDEMESYFANFSKNIDNAHDARIKQIAERYGARLQSWDVVNESALDVKNILEGRTISKSNRYGVMPGDYPYKALKSAEMYFPKEVKLNINDFVRKPAYTAQVKRLLERGCKIDIMGIQMHLMKPKMCSDIAAGKKIQTPKQVRQYVGWASQTGLPIHMSEITIAAPAEDEHSFMIQAIITQNLYRLWFSQKNMMGITWWNAVDGCGRKGEPSISGIFTRDMQEKPAYHALDQLINHEWKTNTTVKADKGGNVEFRGFKGKYRITYKNDEGKTESVEYILK